MQDYLSRKHDSLQIIYENLASRRMHYNWISVYIVFVISQILFCSGLKIFLNNIESFTRKFNDDKQASKLLPLTSAEKNCCCQNLN